VALEEAGHSNGENYACAAGLRDYHEPLRARLLLGQSRVIIGYRKEEELGNIARVKLDTPE